ncbi:hypothetical protein LQ953_10430 [Sphingomonas sp. IC-56]|uniref:hypothetical protein n=1 Tax=Sphingomonas sp. IC-56 TaxID=2898529 RepID=UPI001E469FAC|nr:hypothetical protein [Sphingomonas sp. IC-56]MCD2324429.1 hypothetical protein [Sphingomonas sp. IC-56]
MKPVIAAILVSATLPTCLALPAFAQTARPDGQGPNGSATIIDIIVVDQPTVVVDEGVLEQGMRRSSSFDPAKQDSASRNVTKGMVAREGFRLQARAIVEETLGLDAVPQLQFTAPGNKAAAEQDGTRNAARINQSRGSAGWAVGNQLGEDNRIDIEQADAARPGQYSRNRAYVGQVSFGTASGRPEYRQTAIINQVHRVVRRDVTPNNAAIQQGGIRGPQAGNEVATLQAIGENNVAQIKQNGSGNDGLIQQGAEDARLFSVEYGDTVGRNNRAILMQVGLGNRAVTSQEDDSDAITHQTGDDNQAFVHQDGDVDNAAQFSEIQQGTLEKPGNGNFAAVLQRGLGQQSRIYQRNNDNTAFVEQSETALYARSEISQSGSSNFATVLQDNPGAYTSDGVFSAVSQAGQGNQSWTIQRTDSSRSFTNQAGQANLSRVQQ